MSQTPNAVDVDRFLADPSKFFGDSHTRMMSLSREQLDQLQLAGLKRRFGHFRGRLPMLDRLADSQGVGAITAIDAAAPLLFDHAIYKSYPGALLDKHRYSQLTTWLGKLTTIDLSKVDVSNARSIDDWMLTLKRETPLAVVHTSGTSGTMSFLPCARQDWETMVRQFTVIYFQRFGHDDAALPVPLNIDCIFPFFRSGGLSHTVVNDAIVSVIAGGEERFHAAYPERLSADMMRLAARRRAAVARGQLDTLEIDPVLAARREEFEAQQRDMPRRAAEFFSNMQTRLGGRRVFILAPAPMLFTLAENGLRQGLGRIFSPNSVVVTGGGGKGLVLPDDWQETVKSFFGPDRIFNNYGMSEMAGQLVSCEHGHYHVMPQLIPYILHPDTGAPLPRVGTVTGRFAFYDLIPDTHWGGFVTGDEVTMVWDAQCSCGRTTSYLEGRIQRFSEKAGAEAGEEKLSCAAAPDAYAEALDFLNDGLAV